MPLRWKEVELILLISSSCVLKTQITRTLFVPVNATGEEVIWATIDLPENIRTTFSVHLQNQREEMVRFHAPTLIGVTVTSTDGSTKQIPSSLAFHSSTLRKQCSRHGLRYTLDCIMRALVLWRQVPSNFITSRSQGVIYKGWSPFGNSDHSTSRE
ncbi:hypothetical protein TcWFU_005932 [Taenia crassiceps]|uniref:Uncharacterized protein n=1 Tax=Taenia crassiceps TaxID=6207 RepID=A0ABR4QHY4_9CEST